MNIKNLAFSLALIASLNNAYAQQAYIAPSLENQINLAQANEQIPCLLQLKTQANLQAAKKLTTKNEKGNYVYQTLKAVAETTQKPIIDFLENQGIKYQSFYVANVIYVEATKAQLQVLSQMENIAALVKNATVQAPQIINEKTNAELPFQKNSTLTNYYTTWGISKIKADKLWDAGFKGNGIIIGGQDTGYELNHPTIKSKYKGYVNDNNINHNYNWHDAIHFANPMHIDANNPCGFDALAPCDDDVHGTHTMGTMVGGSDNDGTHIGVAPEATWIGCRNMDRGWGSAQTYIECFEWFLAPTDLNNQNPDPTQAPHVINNSWGCPAIEGCDNANIALMNIVVENLQAAGIVVVVSAGNDGPDCNTINTPAPIFNASFTVGASDIYDEVASFSSRGLVTILNNIELKPNVVAPGVNIYSAIYDNAYSSFQGTSMAGPHVAGAVALLISAKPSLAGQVDSIKHILQASATPIYAPQTCDGISGYAHPNPIAGYGVINLEAALQMLNLNTAVQNSLSQNTLNIYPNPTQDNLQIELPQIQGNYSMTVYNTLGQVIYNTNLENNATIHTLSVHNFANGLYILQVINKDNNQSYKGKFLKG